MFDRFLSSSRPSWRRRRVLITSLGLHGLVAVGLLVASFFHVAELTPPLLAITFVSPPPPSGSAATSEPATPKPARPRPHRAAIRATVVQPTPLVPTVDEPGDTSPDDGPGEPGGPGGPGPGGPAPGIPGGTGTGPIASLPPRRPMNVPPHLLDAQRIGGRDPHLPPAMLAQHAGERGLTFIARVCVDQSGNVSQINVVQSLPGADANIVDELRRWRYKPQPIPVCFMSNFVFDVDGR